ncbi:uncharacterized protein LOC110977845 isoform X3 [Acanthaster planci]|uniref:Uncharacterized protein LOC110977845 isoform X3 n=1 Tax=Acanthaster planci TaxID=133434 RepID=A0A8B7Y8E2_ACAPL|nr:uncharacterized protein LOC110977845 isoform X3 [Acanthaster planci]
MQGLVESFFSAVLGIASCTLPLNWSARGSELEVHAQMELETMACRQSSGSGHACIQRETVALSTASKCLGDSDKIPEDKTIVHVMSRESQQNDGLLQVTDQVIGTDTSGKPVYKVDFRGCVGCPNTDLVWYMVDPTDCDECKRVYLHTLNPAEPFASAARSGTPLENYSYRLCHFKDGQNSFLAAHKAGKARSNQKFDVDWSGLIDVCYHPTKGGMVTLQENSNSHRAMDGLFFGASRDGEVHLFGKSTCQGYCINPFTLFYVYDDVSGEQSEELKRTNGEK